MPHRFCAICGKNIDETAPHFGMCLECYLNESPLFKFSEKFSFKICLDCGSYARKEVWILPEKNDTLHIIKEAIYHGELTIYTISIENRHRLTVKVQNVDMKGSYPQGTRLQVGWKIENGIVITENGTGQGKEN